MIQQEDLMIGDWLTHTYVDYLTKESVTIKFRVMGYDNMGYLWSESGRTCRPEEADGIPLTPEILEKNGFINGEFYAESHIEDWQIMSDGSHLAARSERGWCIDIPCQYVHELQHALKLCRIDKEIEL